MGEILSVFGIDWRLLIIQGFNFGVLLLALWYFLYRPVVRMIEERRAKIEEGVRDAQRAQERLRETEAAETARLSSAEQEAERIVETARGKAKEEGASILAAARERSDSVLLEAQQRAQEEKRRAMEESREGIAKAAVLAAEKILREKAS